jgi:GTPase SAR1 family protein
VRNEFYRDTQGALLVFDVGSRASFESLGRWLEEAAAHGAPRGMVRARARGGRGEGGCH